MASLIQLYEEHGQSPWLDNLTRAMLRDGTTGAPGRPRRAGRDRQPHDRRRAIESSDAYDEQFHDLLAAGHTLEDAYWDLVVTDVIDALDAAAADLRRQRGRGRVRLDRGGARRWPTTRRQPSTAARDLHKRIGAAEPAGQDPRHQRRRACHRGDDR